MAIRQDASTGQMVDDHKPAAAPSKDARPTMQLKIFSPFKVYFDAPAYSLTAVNGTGPFDVLPRHHSFICLLEPCEVVIQAASGAKKIRISGGLLHVRADEVKLFLDV